MQNLQAPLSPAKKIEIRVVYGMLILIALIFLLLAYWIFIPIETLMIKQLPLPVTKPEDISSGRIIVLRFDYCKYTTIHGQVTRQMISDRSAINLPLYNEAFTKGCHKTDAPIILPYTLATQTFHIHYRVEYPVNPLRSEIVEFDSAKFTILPVPKGHDQTGSLSETSDAELIPSALLFPTPLPTSPSIRSEILLPQVENTISAQPPKKAQAAPAAEPQNATPTQAQHQVPNPTPTQIIKQVLQTVKDILNLK